MLSREIIAFIGEDGKDCDDVMGFKNIVLPLFWPNPDKIDF